MGVRPGQIDLSAGCDVLGNAVELASNTPGKVVRLRRPVVRKHLVRLAAEKERIHGHNSGDDFLADGRVLKRSLPTTEAEPSLGIFLWSSRSLGDKIQRAE